jgi:PAS domain S-box-containing protein
MSAPIDYEALVAASGDAVILSDVEGLVQVWNPAAERMFGFTADEALGTSLDLIIPEKQRKRHWDQYAKTMETGQTRYGHELLRVPALHKDGRTLSIAFTVGLLFGADGAVTGVLAVVRDETARWTQERELKRRLAELEAKPRVEPST